MTTIRAGDGDSRHGTTNGYGNLGCRCEACRAANTEKHYEYMHAKPERLILHNLRQDLHRKAKQRVARG